MVTNNWPWELGFRKVLCFLFILGESSVKEADYPCPQDFLMVWEVPGLRLACCYDSSMKQEDISVDGKQLSSKRDLRLIVESSMKCSN
jgi:hypothetical protein